MQCKTCRHWQEHEIVASEINAPPSDKKYGTCYVLTVGAPMAFLKAPFGQKPNGHIETEQNFYCKLYEPIRSSNE